MHQYREYSGKAYKSGKETNLLGHTEFEGIVGAARCPGNGEGSGNVCGELVIRLGWRGRYGMYQCTQKGQVQLWMWIRLTRENGVMRDKNLRMEMLANTNI